MPEFREGRGQFVVDFISCLTCTQGTPFLPMSWQEDAVRKFYGWVTKDDEGDTVRKYQYLYLEIPKKNGKSELSAALGLYHMVADGEENGEVYLCAADRENAGIVFNAALYMVRNSKFLSKRLKIVESQRLMKDRKTGTIMKVLSSEAYSKHGYKPSCVIFDELHAQPNRDLWDVMTFGAGSARREPVWIVLTTAGDDPDRGSIGWEVHEKAMHILSCRAGRNAQGDYDDPLWLPIVYGLSTVTWDDQDALDKLDIYDETLWARCNPSLGKTVKRSTVRQEARNAKQSEAAERLFRWLRLNQWIATKTVGWLPLTLYDRTQWHGDLETLRGKRCYGGLDLSSTTDLTALVLLFPPQEGLEQWVALFRAWVPDADIQTRERRDHKPYRDWIRAKFITGCPGDMIDFGMVEDAIVEASVTYQLELLGADPYLFRMMGFRLANLGLPVAEIPQDIATLSPAMKELERMLRGKELLHEHNTCARWCFGNVRCHVDGNENLKPMKNKSTGRIDITVAWIIAVAVAMFKRNGKPGLREAMERGNYTL